MEKKKYYPDVNPNPNFPELEEKTLAFWAKDGTFQKSIDQRTGSPDFIFYDGPPFANGLPHYGHLLTGYVKDVFARYQTMQGKKVERKFGWDCHGLPAEMGVEKELGISGRAAIMNYGIDKFNDACRADVMKYASEWEKYVNRQARWVDFKNDYKTMDKSFMESVMWAMKELFDKGLLYEAMRVMPYSWAAETPLSNFETRLDNSYRDRSDKAVTVAFKIIKHSNYVAEKLGGAGSHILAWTTTPWTLPSNLALAVHPEMTYVIVPNTVDSRNEIVSLDWLIKNFAYFKEKSGDKDDAVILSEENIDSLKSGKSCFLLVSDRDYPEREITPILGKDLIGTKYEPLFPYFDYVENAFKIISGDFIEEGSGTGVVHIAPGFGEDDQRVAEENGIEMVVPVDNAGRYTDAIFDLPNLKLKGLNVIKELKHQTAEEPYKPEQLEKNGLANLRIISYLKTTGHLIKTEDYIHSYPHCWRTDQPLIYKALPSWYVEVTKFKDRMVELNQGINWIPEHVKDGLFGKWLEGARDWSISRNRFWGAPIPIWKTKSGKLKCVGSIAELENLSGQKVPDLHRPYIDEVKFTINGEEYTRVEDVLDCWFESGSMPYASQGYKGEGELKNFPADFIVEYTAQTRGWFYTMMVLSTALFDKAPFLNCICHGVVLDAAGQKLSKRLNNYPDPLELFKEYGSDALRWAMLSSPIMRGQELYIDKEGKFIRDVVRLYIKPIWNAYNFFTLYANADGIKAKYNTTSENLMDKYILAKAYRAASDIKDEMDRFNTPDAYKAVEGFFEALNNWYIRRSKERFWREKPAIATLEMDSDRLNSMRKEAEEKNLPLHLIIHQDLENEFEHNESGWKKKYQAERDNDKQDAYDTLYTVLHIMCRAAAPLLPLTFEEIYKNLTKEDSVHLTDFPQLPSAEIFHASLNLASEMDHVRDICNTALSIRNAQNIRVRQPLAEMTLVGDFNLIKKYDEIIKDELNVKKISYAEDITAFAEYKLKINFPVLGKRLPEKMKQIIPAVKQNKWKIIGNGGVEILGEILTHEECELLLEPKTKENSAPLSTNDALVVLDLKLTPELTNEGLARDVVRMVQQARKDADLNVADRIDLSVETDANIIDFKDYIAEQTLAKSINLGAAKGKHVFENELEGKKIRIGFNVA